jgi:hypothetical protein
LDALGVKRIWETKDPAEVLKDWDRVYYTFSDELKSLSGVSMSAFSDTLIISMRGHRELITKPWKFVELLCKSITPAFVRSMHYEFFFRGVIVMGYFYRSPRMLIGPAVDEAAKFYEMSDWIGMSLSPSTGLSLENSMVSIESNIIVRYNIPQKPGANMRWAVNWIEHDASRKCWNILAAKANSYHNDKCRYVKYKNTLDFYGSCSNLR